MNRLLLVLASSLLASASAAQPPQVERVDPSGIPVWCPGIAPRPPLQPTLSIEALPSGTRGWECVPGVIRNDGVETFRLEVDVNGAVQAVRLTSVTPYVIGPSAEPVVLHDDGVGVDRVAGDAICTAGPFRANLALSFPAFYANDSSSPSGLYSTGLGTLTVEEVGGALTQFLLGPSIGLLRADVPAVSVVQSGVDRVITPHLVNLSSPDRVTQKFMRFLGVDIGVLTRRVYAALPDVFDFLFFFSNDKVERTPRTSSDNFVAGLHSQVQTNYTGTGLVPYSDAAWYGSAGKLLGINCLDAYDRGVVGNNATHELIHQWGSYTSMSLNLNDGTSHYHYLTSVGSLIGGFAWTDNGNGTFTRNCDEGRNGGHHASPLDLYMMGLIADTQVPGQRRSQLPGSPVCDQIIDSYTTTTVADIQAVHGARTPGPATSQKTFALGFVIESNGRLLNATERTYYDRLAEHYTKVLPAQTPDPYVGFNWPPVTRFFGQGTTWISDIVQLTTAVAPPPAARVTLALAAPYPNPAREGVRVEWTIPDASAEARLDVIDSQGRRVRALAHGAATPGWRVAFWDGKDSEGRAAAPGVYWIRLRHPAGAATRKLVRISGRP